MTRFLVQSHPMRFYPQQHKAYWGIDLHARTMSLCILNQDGESLRHRNLKTHPEMFRRAMAPYREALVVAVACLFPWYGLADLCAQAQLPFVLGPALSLQASHGGKAKNDQSDAQQIAVLLRGGRLPQASGSPAARRATRDLRRRRMPRRRKRAELLTPLQHTKSPYNVPEIGKKIASKANRDGVAERCADPAGPQSIAVALALSAHYDRLLRAMELTLLTTAKPHDATTLSRRRTVPGLGEMLSLGLLYALHDIHRFPRGPDCVSYCRLVTCAKASAGKRYGTAGTKLGNASRTWAFAAATVLLLRAHPAGQQDLTRLEKKHAQGQVLTVLAHN